MDYFSKKRFSLGLVLILLIVNIAAISTMLYHILSERSSAGQKTEIPSASQVLISELKLSDEQRERFQIINQFYNQQSCDIASKLTEKRSEMLTQLGEEAVDTLVLNTIAEDIGKLHTELKLLTIQNFLELKKICTPDQQPLLSKIFEDMLESEGHFKGAGKQYRHRYGSGQGKGRGWQKNN